MDYLNLLTNVKRTTDRNGAPIVEALGGQGTDAEPEKQVSLEIKFMMGGTCWAVNSKHWESSRADPG